MMGHRLGTFILVIATLFCLLTAWTSGTAPAKFAESLGLSIANPGGTNEVRSQYAGFFFATALVGVLALAGTLPRQAAFVLLAAIFGGLIVGRVASFVANGGLAGYTPMIMALYVIDSVGFALALTGLTFDRTT